MSITLPLGSNGAAAARRAPHQKCVLGRMADAESSRRDPSELKRSLSRDEELAVAS